MNSFIDFSAKIGTGTKIWHFAVILAGVEIGENCSIASFVEIGRASRIGDSTRIGSHTFLPPNSFIGSRVFIGPCCVFTDDRNPRVNNPNYKAEPPVIEDDVAIGAGCVILPGVHIGAHSLIGAGSVVTRSIPPHSVVYGDHARIRRSLSVGSQEDPVNYDLPYGKAPLPANPN